MHVGAQHPRKLDRLGDRSLSGLGLMGSDDDGVVHEPPPGSVTGNRRLQTANSTCRNPTARWSLCLRREFASEAISRRQFAESAPCS